MHLNERQRIVLNGILEDQRHLADMPTDVGLRIDRGRRRIIARNAIAGLVPLNLAGWLGHAPTNSEHVLFHREYLRLEDMGLIERCNLTGGRRTTHLRLTPEGQRMAKELLTGEYGSDIDDGIDWSSVEFEPVEIPMDEDE